MDVAAEFTTVHSKEFKKKLFKSRLPHEALEIYAIYVKSKANSSKYFDKIEMIGSSRVPIYSQEQDQKIIVSKDDENGDMNELLVLSGPKIPKAGMDPVSITIGDYDWRWYYEFVDYRFPPNKVCSIDVPDPGRPNREFEEGVRVTLVAEWIKKSVQAHLNVIYEEEEVSGDKRELRIIKGEISAVSPENHLTKRVLRYFGGDESALLEPGKDVNLGRSVLSSHVDAEFVVEFDLEISVNAENSTSTTIPFKQKAVFKAPEDPWILYNRDLIPIAMDFTKVRETLKIDELAKITVEVSWFNDWSPDHYMYFNY